MNKGKWSIRVLVRYTLLQVPGLVVFVLILLLVRHWVDLPAWLLWGAMAVWLGKELILYPLVWRAYDPRQEPRANTMIGAQGVVKEPMAPSGYVSVRGELWRAELQKGYPPVEKGARVRVQEARGLTLIVRPISAPPSGRS